MWQIRHEVSVVVVSGLFRELFLRAKYLFYLLLEQRLFRKTQDSANITGKANSRFATIKRVELKAHVFFDRVNFQLWFHHGQQFPRGVFLVFVYLRLYFLWKNLQSRAWFRKQNLFKFTNSSTTSKLNLDFARLLYEYKLR